MLSRSGEATDTNSVIAVDQVGYRPSDEKRAIVSLNGGSFVTPDPDPPAIDYPDVPPATSFSVINLPVSHSVYSGPLDTPISAPDTGIRVCFADFSDVTTPGTYEIRIDGRPGRSLPFRIADDVYSTVFRDVGRLYTLKRSNTAIDDPETGLSIEPGHPQDGEAALYYAGAELERAETIDVAGGWYDAGDYGKYVPPAAITLGFHLLAFEIVPDAFASGQYDMPQSVKEADGESAMPDVLAEARFELEWLRRMQRSDGAFYHKVAGKRWSPWGLTPAEDTQDRFVYGTSTFGTAMAAGALAMAARIFEPFDSTFSSSCLRDAEAAFSYLQANPEPEFRFDDGQDDGSGPYRKDGDAAERYWAAAELLKTTDDPRYHDYLTEEATDQLTAPVRTPTWGNARTFGHWAYRTAELADEEITETIDIAFEQKAETLTNRASAHGFRVALETDDYHWASAKVAVTHGVLLALAYEMEPRDAFSRVALDQLHYVLGRSPTGYSYVTEYGSRPPRQPHDRLVASTGRYLPGMLVGGPNANGDDDVMATVIERNSPPAALAYLDAPRAYSVNEWAIDYSAPLLFLLAWIHRDH